ncbi:hypothetical protein [Aeromicrobium panaciterrae]|uniref:hypothetical protein n=1 Tax=Aeromicrobium panaciterrae TaxID=363861 RepID=UPI0031D04718
MWISSLFRRRPKKPDWDSLTHEEQGIILCNSQQQSHGDHEGLRAQGWGPPAFNHDPSRR